jgi:hypothetical protein
MLDMVLSSLTYCPTRGEDVTSAIAQLLSSPSCAGDADRGALLHEAQLALAVRTEGSDGVHHARQTLLEAAPDSPAAGRAALALGDSYLTANRPREALSAFLTAKRAALHLSPQDRLSARLGMAAALVSLGRLQEAAFHYRAVIAALDALAVGEHGNG